jgi:hypothetical protein
MNKRVNTILFILGATVFNIIITILSFLVLLIIYAKTIMRVLPENAQTWSFPFIFIAALAVAFFAYRYALRYLLKRIEIEKYFDPIFVSKHRKQ